MVRDIAKMLLSFRKHVFILEYESLHSWKTRSIPLEQRICPFSE